MQLPELTNISAFSPHYNTNQYAANSRIDEKTTVHLMINTTYQCNVRTFSFKMSIENKTATIAIIYIKIINPTIITVRRLGGFMNINIRE